MKRETEKKVKRENSQNITNQSVWVNGAESYSSASRSDITRCIKWSESTRLQFAYLPNWITSVCSLPSKYIDAIKQNTVSMEKTKTWFIARSFSLAIFFFTSLVRFKSLFSQLNYSNESYDSIHFFGGVVWRGFTEYEQT